MATDAEITARIVSATALGLTDAQMVALCNRAIADLLSNGRPMISYRISGQEFGFSMFQAQSLLEYYQKRVDGRGSAQLTVSLAEFP
jgi:hypothetical protein